jgi:hypothetical protein
MELNTKNFDLNDIWTILSLVDEDEYRYDKLGGVEYHTFEVGWGCEVEFGDETVTVEAGTHQLLLNEYSREWMGYVKIK